MNNDHTEAEDTPIMHYYRPDGPTASLVQSGPRAAAWLKIFHRLDGIPVTSFYPVEYASGARAFDLDLTRITGAERARLITRIVELSGAPAHIVDQELDFTGWPIQAEDVTVSIPFRLIQ